MKGQAVLNQAAQVRKLTVSQAQLCAGYIRPRQPGQPGQAVPVVANRVVVVKGPAHQAQAVERVRAADAAVGVPQQVYVVHGHKEGAGLLAGQRQELAVALQPPGQEAVVQVGRAQNLSGTGGSEGVHVTTGGSICDSTAGCCCPAVWQRQHIWCRRLAQGQL
jgi:hypothetical protein